MRHLVMLIGLCVFVSTALCSNTASGYRTAGHWLTFVGSALIPIVFKWGSQGPADMLAPTFCLASMSLFCIGSGAHYHVQASSLDAKSDTPQNNVSHGFLPQILTTVGGVTVGAGLLWLYSKK